MNDTEEKRIRRISRELLLIIQRANRMGEQLEALIADCEAVRFDLSFLVDNHDEVTEDDLEW